MSVRISEKASAAAGAVPAALGAVSLRGAAHQRAGPLRRTGRSRATGAIYTPALHSGAQKQLRMVVDYLAGQFPQAMEAAN